MTSVSNRTFVGAVSLTNGMYLLGSLNNTSVRPALTTVPASYEIRSFNSAGITDDGGFLRLSAGGGTSTNTQSYIDISGSSSISDMNKNIVFGTSGTERLRIDVNGTLISSPTTSSTSSTTGSFLLSGGIGISNTTDASSSTNGGSLTTAGGIAIAKSLWIGTTMNIAGVMTSSNATASTSNTTGSLLLSGGIGISNTTDASSATNGGSLTLAGGAAIAKSLYVGSKIAVNPVLSLTELLTVHQSGTGVSGSIAIQAGLDGSASTANTCSLFFKYLAGDGSTINHEMRAHFLAGTGAYGISFIDNNASKTLLRLHNAGASTSSTAGSCLLTGGLSISATTDATSSTNGGTLTTAGGIGVTKSLIIGANLLVTGASSYQSVNGEIFSIKRNNTTINQALGQTLTASNVIAGYIIRSGQNSGQTDTFPTAALLVAGVTSASIGTQWTFIYNNTSTEVMSFGAGSGNIIYGSTSVAGNSYVTVTFSLTNVTASTETCDILIK